MSSYKWHGRKSFPQQALNPQRSMLDAVFNGVRNGARPRSFKPRCCSLTSPLTIAPCSPYHPQPLPTSDSGRRRRKSGCSPWSLDVRCVLRPLQGPTSRTLRYTGWLGTPMIIPRRNIEPQRAESPSTSRTLDGRTYLS